MDIDFTLEPRNDGIDHINIYSRARTDLGKWLSNFTYSPFTHPDHGQFASIEGYWYWLKTGMIHDKLRGLYGVEAKRYGRTLTVSRVEKFNDHIIVSLYSKILQYPEWQVRLKESTLPFFHYYVQNGIRAEAGGSEWIIDEWENIRRLLRDSQ